MKQLFSSRMMRISMVIVLALGFSIESNAQFGGLLNAAKRKASKAISDKVSNTTSKASEGSVVSLYYASGNPMGEWNPSTRQYTQMAKVGNEYKRGHVYTFEKDGSVTVDNGRRIGEILEDGTMNTAQTQNIKFNAQTGEVTRNGEWYGKMGDDNGLYLFNDKMGWSNNPMDKQIQAFILFNLIADNELLDKYKQKYDEKVKFNNEMRQQQIANAKADAASRTVAAPVTNAKADAAASRTGGASVTLWKGGSVAGEIRSNNQVWISGSNRGKIESNGDIWVGGSVAGQILSNGDIRKGGSIIGKVDGGRVWQNGSVIGEIRQNGDVVKNGSVIGRAEGMKDARAVAVVFFYGFFNL